MPADSPTVTIGLPVYNGAQFVCEAIDSLLAQSFTDFELIISDNASTDETVKLCEQYAQRDSRIRIVHHQENVGASENFNHVFREARGRYFKWAAADDHCLPDFLKACIEVLEKNPDISLCYPQTATFGARSKQKPFPGAHEFADPSLIRRVGRAMHNAPVADYIFGVMRRDLLGTTGLIGPFPSADRVLLLELALRGRFEEVPEVMFRRRVHAKQSIRAYTSKRAMAAWFSTNNARGRIFPEWRLVAEFTKAILRAPLPVSKRLRSLFELRHWFNHRWRSLLKEMVPTALHQPGKRVLGRT